MNKALMKLYAMVLVLMLGLTVFQFFSSADRPANLNALSSLQAAKITAEGNVAAHPASGFHLIAGICALLLVGYLYWVCFQKFQNESRGHLDTAENTLYDISLATGYTEYDLFHKSAENWSVSKERIDQDYVRYMTDQVMPHYAQDFVRKNRTQIDESLFRKQEVEPTSWLDWAIAVLVFPGSVMFLYVLMALIDKH